jgi:cbb3-type cytochrome oxidase subunit 3
LWVIPWLLVVIVLVILLLIAWLIWRRRRGSIATVSASADKAPEGVKQ